LFIDSRTRYAFVSFPEVWVPGNEAYFVYLKFGHEKAAIAFVVISRCVNSPVNLKQGFKSEAGETKPCGIYLCLLTDSQLEPAYRQQVRRWTEIQIQIDTSRHRRRLFFVEKPVLFTFDHNFNLDFPIAYPAANGRASRVPAGIADDAVIKPARKLVVREDSGPLQMP